MEALVCKGDSATEGCGGELVDTGDGMSYQCRSCGKSYNREAGSDGVATLVLTKRIDRIAEHTEKTALIAEEERLRKKLSGAQERVDLKRMEIEASASQNLFYIAMGMMIFGGLLAVSGLGSIGQGFFEALLIMGIGGGLAFGGWSLLQHHKKQGQEQQAALLRLEREQLEPLRKQVADIRKQLDR